MGKSFRAIATFFGRSYSTIIREYHRKWNNKALRTNDEPKKVALVAVMRKLIVIAYGVLKSQKPFDVNYAK